jgi:hypothetical protein
MSDPRESQLSRVTIENVTEAQLEQLMQHVGEFAVTQIIPMSNVESNVEATSEVDKNSSDYNPALVSFLKSDEYGSQSGIPVLPKHKLAQYARDHNFTGIISERSERRSSPSRNDMFGIRELESSIYALSTSGRRLIEPEKYTYRRILRADKLAELLVDIHKDPTSYLFSKEQVRFLEACEADLRLSPEE